jgi:hypothetical protein
MSRERSQAHFFVRKFGVVSIIFSPYWSEIIYFAYDRDGLLRKKCPIAPGDDGGLDITQNTL